MTESAEQLPVPRRSEPERVVPVRVGVSPVRKEGEGASAPRAPKEFGDFIRMIHRALRGYYILAIILGLIAAAGGAYAGWRLGFPTFHSESLLRVAYTLPEVMHETDQNKPMAMFDTFMLSQRMLITSRRVIDNAMTQPVWKALGRQLSEKPDAYFGTHLEVEIKPRSEFILIKVTDRDPLTAQAAVQAVTAAYQEVYNDQDQRAERTRTSVLEQRKQELIDGIRNKKADLEKESIKYGSSNLEAFAQASATRVIQLENARANAELALKSRSFAAATSQPAPTSQPAAPVIEELGRFAKTPEEIAAAGDAEMRDRLDQLSRIQASLDQLRLWYGPTHRNVVSAEFALNQAKNAVEKRAAEYRNIQTITGGKTGDTKLAAMTTAGKTDAQLKADVDALDKLLADTRTEMKNLGRWSTTEKDIRSMQEELTKIDDRIDVLHTEAALAVNGRLSEVGSGQVPLSPDHDPRLKFALAGGLGGLLLPVSLIAMLGMLRRRYQFSDEPEADIATTAPLLGILPDLKNVSDEEQLSAAARCIHQMRVLLRTLANGRPSSIYLITSSTAKEGKTSLTMSLGLSFAASGLRTLVIDADLVGRNLTKGLKAGKLSGLREALEQGSLQKMVRRAQGGVCVLTTGAANAMDACALPPAKMSALFAEARRHFQVILVDTGPILGSLEAAVLAPEVDGAILAVSRGQDRALVKNAVRRLKSLGVTTAGFVYNRAKPMDFQSSPFGSSGTYTSDGTGTLLPDGQRRLPKRLKLDGFGPLVQAVADGIPDPSAN